MRSTGDEVSRTQLPLVAAWAITTRKSQGLTLEKAVIELGSSDYYLGESFVAISRIKKLSDLAFKAPFGIERLRRGPLSGIRERLKEDDMRRASLGFTLETYGVDLSRWTDAFKD
jgi:hypothetical protein